MVEDSALQPGTFASPRRGKRQPLWLIGVTLASLFVQHQTRASDPEELLDLSAGTESVDAYNWDTLNSGMDPFGEPTPLLVADAPLQSLLARMAQAVTVAPAQSDQGVARDAAGPTPAAHPDSASIESLLARMAEAVSPSAEPSREPAPALTASSAEPVAGPVPTPPATPSASSVNPVACVEPIRETTPPVASVAAQPEPTTIFSTAAAVPFTSRTNSMVSAEPAPEPIGPVKAAPTGLTVPAVLAHSPSAAQEPPQHRTVKSAPTSSPTTRETNGPVQAATWRTLPKALAAEVSAAPMAQAVAPLAEPSREPAPALTASSAEPVAGPVPTPPATPSASSVNHVAPPVASVAAQPEPTTIFSTAAVVPFTSRTNSMVSAEPAPEPIGPVKAAPTGLTVPAVLAHSPSAAQEPPQHRTVKSVPTSSPTTRETNGPVQTAMWRTLPKALAAEVSARLSSLGAHRAESKPAATVSPAVLDKLRLKAIARFGNRRAASINDQSVFPGDEAEFNVEGGPLRVRCLEIKETCVVLQIAGITGTSELKMSQAGK